MSKHTPGPWLVEGDMVATPAESEDSVEICFMAAIGGPMTRSVREANASLIAAAPDFLKMAYSALAWWEENKHATISLGDGEEDNLYDGEPEFVTQARAAIAKAEGKV